MKKNSLTSDTPSLHSPWANQAIAIIGASCRFPGKVSSLGQFWELLLNGVDGVSEIPHHRWNVDSFTHPSRNAEGKSCVRAGGFIDNIEDFDHEFFGISRKEAEYMDYQQKLVLELAWEALEDAHIRPSQLSGTNTPVYIGVSSFDSSLIRADDACVIGPYSMTGTALSIVANRISYIFNLHGPSLILDTACSSSLAALHQACLSLQSNSSLAIAGGVNLLYSPYSYIGFSQAHMLSSSGRCKVFDSQADGYVRAEGGGIVILKPLQKALRDKDRIHAVILESAINSDGRTQGLAMPNKKAQTALLKQIYNPAKHDPASIAYIEAHGTGTAAGDPVEATAIGEVLGKERGKDNPLFIGSVKSNIGHLETASGMAGLMKTILALKHRKIPANLHLQNPNPAIDFNQMNLSPVAEHTDLSGKNGAILAGVNSFGFGGTNTHLLLQEAPQEHEAPLPSKNLDHGLPPLFISARSEFSLKRLAQSYAGLIQPEDRAYYYSIAHNAALHRDQLKHRLVIQAESPEETTASLNAFADDEDFDAEVLTYGEAIAEHPKTAFVFSGNGSQWHGMGQNLLKTCKTFFDVVGRLDSILSPYLGWSAMEELQKPPEQQALYRTEVSQPLLFVLQAALADLLQDWGVVPSAVYGHSLGEISAAYACGALPIQDACMLIAHRSALQGKSFGMGKMASVNISYEECLKLPQIISGEVEIAAVNAPASLTLTGQAEPLLEIQKAMKSKGLFFKLLDLEYPFHSKYMERFKDPLLDCLKDLKPQNASVDYVSTVTGDYLDGKSLDAAYWWKNLRRPVLFSSATNTLLDDDIRIFLEIGPNAVLQYYVRECTRKKNASALTFPLLKRDCDETVMIRKAWKKIYTHGWPLQMRNLFPENTPKIDLPGYVWDKSYCSATPTHECLNYLSGQPGAHPLLGYRHKDCELWEKDLDLMSHPFLKDHKIAGYSIFPASGYLETAAAASYETHEKRYHQIDDLHFQAFLFLPQSNSRVMRTLIDNEDGYFRIESRTKMTKEGWTVHCTGKISPGHEPVEASEPFMTSPETFGQEIDVQSIYQSAWDIGLEYGPVFKSINKLWTTENEVLAALKPSKIQQSESWYIDPTLVDGAFQSLLGFLLHKKTSRSGVLLLPTRISSVQLIKKGEIAFSHARIKKLSLDSVVASFTIMDSRKEPVAILKDCRFSHVYNLKHLEKSPKQFVVQALPSRHPHEVAPPDLPDPQAIKDNIAPVMNELAGKINRKTYYQELLPLSKAALLSRLHEIACRLTSPDHPFTVDEIFQNNGFVEAFKPYFKYALNFLEANEMLIKQGDCWVTVQEHGLPAPSLLWRTIVNDYPAYLPEAVIIGRLGLHLNDLLLGIKSAEDILSIDKNGSVESYYLNAPSARLMNSTLREILSLIFKSGDRKKQLKILEIGAGTGGFMTNILPVLPGHLFEYHATDKDREMVENMTARFGNRPEVHFSQLDIENIEQVQLDELGSFDVIVTANILNETNNLNKALANCLHLLVPGGLMLVSELFPTPATCLTLGIRPEFWELSPDADNPVPRLLPPEQWLHLLQREGFKDVQMLMESQVEEPDCFILAAQKSVSSQQMLQDKQADLSEEKRRWLLIEDDSPHAFAAEIGAELQSGLANLGFEAVRITAGSNKNWSNDSCHDLNPYSHEQWKNLLAHFADKNIKLEVINLLGFDPEREVSSEKFHELLNLKSSGTAMLAKAWSNIQPDARLWQLSSGAFCVNNGNGHGCVASQGCTPGLVRVLCNEMPGLDVRLIDIQGEKLQDVSMQDLIMELVRPSQDKEVILKDCGRYSPRIAPYSRHRHRDIADRNIESRITLNFDQPGKLDNLKWKETDHRLPQADEIEIKTKATGLNFRDIMYTLGYLPDEALEDGYSGPSLGLECSGEVVSTGDDVKEFSAGDEVIAMSGACFDSHVIANNSTVFPKPPHWTFEEAATIPVAFFTAYYALKYQANLQPGEKILIHGGAGGVGLAAFQVARLLEAEIFTTAGTPEKRDFLKLLGIPHVLNSRSLNFDEKILEITREEGVDVVLNCLAGQALVNSLAILKPFGRFLELGKRDFYANSPLRMRLLRNNISFFGIDVDQIMRFRPDLGRKIFQEIMQLCQDKKLTPLLHSVFPRSSTAEAFRNMQRARHIGKIVINYDESSYGVQKSQPLPHSMRPDPDGTYVVSGGLSGIGLTVARHLISLGARNIVLLSRSGASDPSREKALQEMTSTGAQIKIVTADVSCRASLDAGLTEALNEMPALKGVVHCAAVLRDGFITNQTPEYIEEVLGAKALGAWNLHLYTKDIPLDFFIMFSSATTVFGNPGQLSYVAANTVLENIAAYRRFTGLHGLALGWGPVSDTGMLQRDPAVLETLKKSTGIVPLSSESLLHYMDLLTNSHEPSLFVFNLDWKSLNRFPVSRGSLFNLIPEAAGNREYHPEGGELVDSLKALPPEKAIKIIADNIGDELSTILRTPASRIKHDVPIAELGMDSLMGVELGLALEKRFALSSDASVSLGQNTTVNKLAAAIYHKMFENQLSDEAEMVVESLKQHGLETDLQQAQQILEQAEEGISNPEKGKLT